MSVLPAAWVLATVAMTMSGAAVSQDSDAIVIRFAPGEIAAAALLRLPEGFKPPPDPSNHVADDPRAATLGAALFADRRLSANGKVSCSQCHRPVHAFADDKPFSVAIGKTERNAPTLVGAAFSQWYFADGRRDSQWSQAIAPLLHPKEHGLTRTGVARRVFRHYRSGYESIFGIMPPLDDTRRFPAEAGPEGDRRASLAWRRMAPGDRDAVNRVLANTAKAVAAFERGLVPARARFDRFADLLVAGRPAEAVQILSRDEIQGFRLFVGAGRCIQCHNGPMFSNYEFHNIGLHLPGEGPLLAGRRWGLSEVRQNDFNCLGAYSDDARSCALRYAGRPEAAPAAAFKTATLRNIGLTAPYMHTGEFATLDDVLDHYNGGGRFFGMGGNELQSLALDPTERAQIKSFLLTLTGAGAPGAARSGDRGAQ